MATNLQIDIGLLEMAYKLSCFKTKRETVNEALRKFIQLQHQKQILNLLGTVEFRDDYDYKKGRNRA